MGSPRLLPVWTPNRSIVPPAPSPKRSIPDTGRGTLQSAPSASARPTEGEFTSRFALPRLWGVWHPTEEVYISVRSSYLARVHGTVPTLSWKHPGLLWDQSKTSGICSGVGWGAPARACRKRSRLLLNISHRHWRRRTSVAEPSLLSSPVKLELCFLGLARSRPIATGSRPWMAPRRGTKYRQRLPDFAFSVLGASPGTALNWTADRCVPLAETLEIPYQAPGLGMVFLSPLCGNTHPCLD